MGTVIAEHANTLARRSSNGLISVVLNSGGSLL